MGQALRIVERCTDAQDANQHLGNLETKLYGRNYPENLKKRKSKSKSKRSKRPNL